MCVCMDWGTSSEYFHMQNWFLWQRRNLFTARHEPNLEVYLRPIFVVLRALPWLWRLVSGFSPWRHGFDPMSVRVRLWWAEWHWDGSYLGFPRQHHSSNAPSLSSSARCLYQEKLAEPGNPPKSHAVSEIRGQWIENNFFFKSYPSVPYCGVPYFRNINWTLCCRNVFDKWPFPQGFRVKICIHHLFTRAC
jgi:hypothetical protein